MPSMTSERFIRLAAAAGIAGHLELVLWLGLGTRSSPLDLFALTMLTLAIKGVIPWALWRASQAQTYTRGSLRGAVGPLLGFAAFGLAAVLGVGDRLGWTEPQLLCAHASQAAVWVATAWAVLGTTAAVTRGVVLLFSTGMLLQTFWLVDMLPRWGLWSQLIGPAGYVLSMAALFVVVVRGAR